MSRIEPKNTYYFQHYNTLFMKIVPTDTVLETKESFRNFLSSVYADKFGIYKQEGDWSSSMYYELTKAKMEYYIRLTHEHGYFDLGKAPLEKLKRLSEENSWTYSKVFSVDEVKYNLDAIMRSGNAAPNYNPKKIERTLESVSDNLYKFVIFKTNNEEEFTDVQKKIRKFGYGWMSEDRILVEADRDFPCYIFVQDVIGNSWDKIIFYDGENCLDGNSPFRTLMERSAVRHRDDICPTLFTSDDAEHILSLFKHGKVVHNTPSYTPRKIDRTLESVDYTFDISKLGYFNNYNTFVCVFDSNMSPSEFNKIITMVDKTLDNCLSIQRRFLMSLQTDVGENSYYISMRYEGKDSDGDSQWDIGYCYLSYLPEAMRGSSRTYSKPFYYYDIDTPEKLRVALEIKSDKPSYEPRKVVRTLEANEPGRYLNTQLGQTTKWPYRFKTRNEFDTTCTKSGRDWECGRYLFIEGMYFLFGRTLEYYYPDDEDYIIAAFSSSSYYVTKLMLVKNDLARPTYEPRKSRLVEKFENKYKYDIIAVQIDSPQESIKIQQLCFDNDIVWQKGKILQYLDQKYLYIWLQDGGITYSVSYTTNDNEEWNTDPKLYTINDYDSIKSIFENGRVSPTYQPRKMDRTLENVSLITEGENMRDALNSYYFQHYNSLIMTFIRKGLDKEKYYKIGEMLQDITDIMDVNYSFENAINCTHTDEFYVAIRLKGQGEDKYLDTSIDDMYHLEQNNNGINAKFPKLYTMNDVDNPAKIMNILNFGVSEPSYKPKKISRDL